MLLIPAIDIKDGHCVRLVQGDLNQATVYSQDPVSQAAVWVEAGARRIHVVDLNGAVDGKPVNADVVGRIASLHPHIEIQVGGGIRSIETVERYLNEGVNSVIIGTRAVHNPEFITEIAGQFPGRVMAGIDVRGSAVATEGWAASEQTDVRLLADTLVKAGASAIVYTDIERDGMMSGVNVDATVELARAIDIPVIASGGIRDLADIRRLLEADATGIMGAIAGKSLYEGSLDYSSAIQVIDDYLREKKH